MDVVAHAGTVGRRIVIAEDSEFLALAHSHLGDIGHQVVGDAVGVLTDASAGVRSHGVKVAQQDDVPFRVGFLDVHQHLLEHRLCPAVGIGTLTFRTVLGDGNLHGVAVDSGAGGEDDVLAAILAHDIDQHQRAADVVLVILPRLLHTLAHSLESGKVNAGVEAVL